MTRALLILTGVALLLAQGISSVAANPGTAQPKCDRCACGGGCCVRKGQPAPVPAAPAPARTFSLKTWLWAAAVATQIYAPPAPLAAKVHYSPSIHSDRLPLYERNCTLLI